MKEKIVAKFTEIYGRAPTVVTRAPGRIEFIGNHTDYNGGIVLGASIDRGIAVAVAPRDDAQRRFASDYSGATPKIVAVGGGKPQRQDGDDAWTNYPLGIIDSFPAFNLTPPEGFDYLAVSDLPVGSGLSSSAAIELASALAFLAITDQAPSREEVVKLARHAENNFVGVPCGILDQGVSGFGKKDHLVFIDCRALTFDTVPLPPDTHFWVFNTHTKHALADGLYEARHTECMDAAKTLGVELLVDGTIEALEAARPKLNESVYRRAKHVIEEIERVRQTVEALKRGDLAEVGKLITASHRSSQHLFENSTPELDFLVDQLTGILDVYGARLTGGGFGGAVMAMTNGRFDEKAADLVADAYRQRFQERPEVLHMQTGDGASVL
ncbi:MAG: galactokinase [Verrucomicrobia bacterium]|nr:MAG: galactokinase [Verrucomicrobiota bacterium]